MTRTAVNLGIRTALMLQRSARHSRRLLLAFRPGWSWTLSHGWIISAAFATATLLIGAGLAGIPLAASGSWHDSQVRAQAWAFLTLGTAGVTVLIAAVFMRYGRDRIRHRNGTAYIIQERAEGWAKDEAREFLLRSGRRFARTIHVPGPAQLAGPWDWPLDAEARHWDEKVTELIRSFQALHSDDDPQSPNGIFMWAWWAVAAAFAERVSAADRELVLEVWQRPSMGRVGRLETIPAQQRAHRFAGHQVPSRPSLTGAEGAAEEIRHCAEVTIETLTAARPGSANRPVSVFILRLGRQSWGPLPPVTENRARPRPLRLTLQDAAGLGLPGQFHCQIREWRSLPPHDLAQFPWATFPQLADQAARWIQRSTAGLDGHTILLGAVMPPEIAFGMGVAAARMDWPQTLWPIIYRPGGGLVIPRLNLGHRACGPGGALHS